MENLNHRSVVLIICLKKSSFQQGVILPPSKHLAMSGDIVCLFFGGFLFLFLGWGPSWETGATDI